MVAEIEAQWGEQYRGQVRGLESILRKSPWSFPRHTKRSPRPWFHAERPAAGREFMARYENFVSDFRNASQLFRAGRWADAMFPAFSFPPWVPMRV
jgi:hypothetical protein